MPEDNQAVIRQAEEPSFWDRLSDIFRSDPDANIYDPDQIAEDAFAESIFSKPIPPQDYSGCVESPLFSFADLTPAGDVIEGIRAGEAGDPLGIALAALSVLMPGTIKNVSGSKYLDKAVATKQGAKRLVEKGAKKAPVSFGEGAVDVSAMSGKKYYHVTDKWDGRTLETLKSQYGHNADEAMEKFMDRWPDMGISDAEGHVGMIHLHDNLGEAKEYQKLLGGEILEISDPDDYLEIFTDYQEYAHPATRENITPEHIKRVLGDLYKKK